MKKIIVLGKVLEQPGFCTLNIAHYRLRVTSISCKEWSTPSLRMNHEVCITVNALRFDVKEIMPGDLIKITFDIYKNSKPSISAIESCNAKQDIIEFVANFDKNAMNGHYPSPCVFKNEEDEES